MKKGHRAQRKAFDIRHLMYYVASVANRVNTFLCVMLGLCNQCLLLPNSNFSPMGKTKLQLLLVLVVYM